MSLRRVLAVIVTLVVVAAAAVAGGVYFLGGSTEKQEAAAQEFARAWTGGTLGTLAYAGATGPAVATEAQAATAGLTSAKTDRPSAVEVGKITQADDGTSAALRVSWALSGGHTWSYASTLPLSEVDGTWRPAFTRAVVHPSLTAKGQLTAARTPGARGDIVSTDGTTLVGEQSVVTVGIEPKRTTDAPATVTQVAALVDVDGAALLKRVQAASPTSFVEAITLREAAYQAVKPQLQAIPGTVFRRGELSLAPSAGFARALLGTVGQATAEIVKDSDGRVVAGDLTGLSGIQRTYDATLSGTAGVTVTATGTTAGAASTATAATPSATDGATASPSASAGSGTAAPAPLFEAKAVDGQKLTVTLDQATQVAAEKALEAAPKPAALVAIKVSTGEVLAVANGGPNASGYNRALIGRYAPGSTFKVASGLALLEQGVTPSTPIACPSTVTVSGYTISNAEDEVLGTVPFRKDFADSCNTAFAGSAGKVTAQQLTDAASSLGYGQADSLGVDAFTGSVPADSEAVAHAASMIGQSKVEVSPLAVAVASASAAKGGRVTPSLVMAPKGAAATAEATTDTATTDTATTDSGATATGSSGDDTTAGAGTASDPTSAASATGTNAKPISAANAQALQGLMRAVVTEGTGTALRNVPGGAVSGKTGTAEFGSAAPPLTHAWFTGFQGDIAFAVLVEDGGFGAKAAAPIAAAFLTDLAS